MRRWAARSLAALALLMACVMPVRGESRSHGYLFLPFEDRAPDPSRDWMQEAMAISLGEYFLAAAQEVIARDDRLMAMDELSVPSGAPLTLATSIKLGRHFAAGGDGPGADRLVVGRFTLDQGQIVVSARVLDLDSNRAGSWKQEEGSLKDLLKIQRALAHALLRGDGFSGNNLAAASDDTGAGHSFPLVAYESCIRGLIEVSPGRQQSLFRKALEQSPGYPKASFHLGRILARGGKSQEAEAVLRKASAEPVPYIAEYHSLLGILALDAGRLSDAEAEAQKSLALKDTAEVRILRARIARAHDDPETARAELDRAAALDPDNPDVDTVRRQIEKPAVPRR